MHKACTVVTGATGFVGRHFLNAMAPVTSIRALTRRVGEHDQAFMNVEWVSGDIRDPAALEHLLTPGCNVVNLAFSQVASDTEAVAASQALMEACARKEVARFIHCSTISVYGRTLGGIIDERTPCNPIDDYGRQKLAIEQALLAAYDGRFDFAILRPAAVFGTGGQALAALCTSLKNGWCAANYGRSALFGRRRMHLVRVELVVAALRFLCEVQRPLRGDIFIAAEDHVARNNFRDVELRLMEALGVPDYRLPVLPLPPVLLKTLLRVRGRSEIDPLCVYDATKLRQWGFSCPPGFDDAVTAFARAANQRLSGGTM